MTAQTPTQALPDATIRRDTSAARNEWRANWPIALASALGLSLATIATYSTGLFFEPVEGEFGWSRAQVAFGMTIYALVAIPLNPFIGSLIDRWGARRIAIPGVMLFGLAFSSLSLVGESIWAWWGLWLFVSLAAVTISPTVWISGVSSRFSTSRALAIAFCLCGTAVASLFAPIVCRWLIDVVGWRLAYVYLGLGWAGLVLMWIFPFFFDARDRFNKLRKATPAAAETEPVLPGLTFREAIRTRAFQKLGLASLFVSMAIVATTVHLVPILTMRGFSREVAAGILGVLGISSACGKLATGWLFGRLDARPLAAICLALPAAPLLMLAFMPVGHAAPTGLAIGTVAMLGFSAGAELSATAYLTTRYVGLRAFAQNYAVISSIMAVAHGIGPFIAGLVYDWTGDYILFLFGGIPTSLAAGLLIATLGTYPVWNNDGSARAEQ